jgi:RNA polymerase sigma factor (sigma-70 family)
VTVCLGHEVFLQSRADRQRLLRGTLSMSQTSASLLERLGDRSDSEAWTRLVELYSPLIRGWLGRFELAESDADDLSQTVMAALVANLPSFRHNGRVGAFRTWLRTITVNSVRQKFRTDRKTAGSPGGSAFLASLNEIDDPASDLSSVWDQAHDAHVLRTLLTWAEPEFEAKTWQAFRRQVFDEARPNTVAEELNMTVNAVLIAKSRGLKRLRELSRGLIDLDPVK